MDRGAAGSAHDGVSQRFSASDRLRKRYEFQSAREQARRVHTRSFVVLVAGTDSGASRLGVTVSRQVGNAVRRNRIKRLLREVFRTQRHLFPASADFVVIAKTGCLVASFDDVRSEFERASASLRAAVHGGARRPGGVR